MIRVLHDFIAIERKPEERNRVLFIPRLPSNIGTVVAVGPKVKEVEVGDFIQFNRYAGYVITGDGLDVTLIHEVDVSVIFVNA